MFIVTLENLLLLSYQTLNPLFRGLIQKTPKYDMRGEEVKRLAVARLKVPYRPRRPRE